MEGQWGVLTGAPLEAQLRTLFSCPPGVQSALYGLALSLLICVAAVAVFTTHVLLLLPVLLSILGMCARGMGEANRQASGSWSQEWAGIPKVASGQQVPLHPELSHVLN